MLGTHFDHVYEYNTVCYCVGQCTLESHILKMLVALLIFTSRFHKYQNYISGGECKRVLCASLFNST